MFSMAPNIVLAPNMTQNAESKHRMQDTNTAPIRPHFFLGWEKSTIATYSETTVQNTDFNSDLLQIIFLFPF